MTNRRLLSPSLLTWLRAFDAAARHGSFTLAAAELHVTQGAISQQVKHLEEWLGEPLFHRAQRRLELSRDGLRLKLAVKEAFQVLEDTLRPMRAQAHESTLNLNCSPSFAMSWLTPRMGALLRAHPEIGLRVYGEFHTLNRSRMEQEGIEAAIRFDTGEYSDVRAEPFLDEWLVPVASPALLEAHPGLRTPADIPTALMLHDASPWEQAQEGEEWNYWLQMTGAPVPAVHDGQHFNMSQLAVSAALAGQGVAMGRLALVLDDLASGRLVPAVPMMVPSRASYFYVSSHTPSPRLQVLEAWLQQESQRFRRRRAAWCRAHGLHLAAPPADGRARLALNAPTAAANAAQRPARRRA